MNVNVTIRDERLLVNVTTRKIEVPVYQKCYNGTVEQLQSGGKVNDLGSISGANEIDLSNGTFVTATLTGAIQLAFTGLPTAGYVKDFVLLFTNIETITFPAGTKFAGGVPPVVIASPYMVVCSVDSAGVVTVYSLIDNIIEPV